MLIVDAQVHIGRPGHRPIRRIVSNSSTAEECVHDIDATGVGASAAPAGLGPELREDIRGGGGRSRTTSDSRNFPLDKPENRSLIDTWKTGRACSDYATRRPAAPGQFDDRRDDGLAVAGGREGRDAHRADGVDYLPQVGFVAERRPGLKLIIDRYTRVRDGEDDAAHGDQPACWRSPDVPMSPSRRPAHRVHRASHLAPQHPDHPAVVEAFRARRAFWGPDITRMPCSWKECVTMFTEEMPWLKGRDLELVMGRAVCDWLGWNLQADDLPLTPTLAPLAGRGRTGSPRSACGRRARVRGLALAASLLTGFANPSGRGRFGGARSASACLP